HEDDVVTGRQAHGLDAVADGVGPLVELPPRHPSALVLEGGVLRFPPRQRPQRRGGVHGAEGRPWPCRRSGGQDEAMKPRTVVRVGGVDIRVDNSWVVIAVLVTWSFWAHFGTDRSGAVPFLMAVVAAALFFASILAHAGAHAREA